MLPIILILAFTVPFFHEDIKGLDYYSYFSQVPNIRYELHIPEASDKFDTILYTPHISSFSGIAVGTKHLSLSLAFQNDDPEKRGVEESKLFDLQLAGVWDNYLWEIYYQNYIGLYISEDENIDDENLPQVNTFSYGLGFKYFFRDGYKLKHSLASYSKKKQTNWSWLWGMLYNRSRLFSQNDTLIPNEYANSFDQLVGLSAFETTNLGLEFGISGMLTIYNFYASALFSVGSTYQKQEFWGLDTDQREITSSVFSALFDVGYDWKHSALGADFQIQSINNPVKNAEFIQSRMQVLFYYKYFF